jgi:hypothetical protein
MLEWAMVRLFGNLCPCCDERHRDLTRHWFTDHSWFDRPE